MSGQTQIPINVEMGQMGNAAPHHQQKNQEETAPQPQPQPQRHHGWDRNDSNTLLVVATLITALTYQLGTNLPGGYYQDDSNGHVAGDSILRDKHRKRYWLFMTASWMGFGNSMLMTLALLTGVPVASRLVRWPFAVAYSSLVLAFISSQANTWLVMDLLIWIFVLVLLYAAISLKNREPRWPAAVDKMRAFFIFRL
ncbi:hypothetical protein GW17_00019936 [Ensete ventricosum]|nr:hypothetical protein GW17_00019936 [Ensete ventricosum]RZS13779.1 hypothetical protein BHM03_00045405 [Ensete ventricosum]